jgi:N-formylglutamate amidohydrolase
LAFNLYADFHAEVAKRLTYLGDDTLLIDCHSFSALPNLLNSNPPDIDICIGFNDDETCPDDGVIGDMARFFGSLGYKVGINEPFSNSKTFSVPVRYHSVMIEINKRLYMDEKTLEKNENFMGIHQMIQSLYEILLTKKLKNIVANIVFASLSFTWGLERCAKQKMCQKCNWLILCELYENLEISKKCCTFAAAFEKLSDALR